MTGEQAVKDDPQACNLSNCVAADKEAEWRGRTWVDVESDVPGDVLLMGNILLGERNGSYCMSLDFLRKDRVRVRDLGDFSIIDYRY